MKFEARYTPTITDGPVIRWGGGIDRGVLRCLFSGEDRTDWAGQISASRAGVVVSGFWPPLARAEDVEDFAATMRKAHDAHLRIASAEACLPRNAHRICKAIVEAEQAARPRDVVQHDQVPA